MKKSSIFAILALLSALASILQLQRVWLETDKNSTNESPDQILEFWRINQKPEAKLNILNLIRSRPPELVDSLKIFGTVEGLNQNEVAALRGARNCADTRDAAIYKKFSSYFNFWRAFCDIKIKSNDWLKMKVPQELIMPMGGTYYAEFISQTSAEDLQPQRLHLFELSNYRYNASLSDDEKMIAGMLPEQIHHLLEGRPLVLTSDSMLVYQNNEYLVYKRGNWDHFVEQKPFVYSDIKQKWIRNPILDDSRRVYFFALVWVSLISLIAAFSIIVVTNRRQKRFLEAKRTLMFRTLAHEVRTPVTSLFLSTEFLRNDFDHLSENGQLEFLRLCNQLQKLKNVIEHTADYLGDKDSITLKPKSIKSINNFVERCLQDLDAEVQFIPLKTDMQFILDSYWFQVCLQNLVVNALSHGKKPVKVKLSSDRKNLAVAVIDQGEHPELNLKKLIKPFAKSERSSGLGLGLFLVEKIVKQMKGRFELSNCPTQFKIILKLQIGDSIEA